MFGLARRAAGPAAALPRMAVRRMGGAHPGVQEPGGVFYFSYRTEEVQTSRKPKT